VQANVPNGVLVPAAALVRRDDRDVVYTVADGKAAKRPVKAANQTTGDLRLVTEGIAAGDTVIVSPPSDLADGAAVRVATTP
jgi:hypothetical protein